MNTTITPGTVFIDVRVEDGIYYGTNHSLNYTAVAPSWDDLAALVIDSAAAEGWKGWCMVRYPVAADIPHFRGDAA